MASDMGLIAFPPPVGPNDRGGPLRKKPEPAPMAEIHKIQVQIYEETKHMSIREKVAYFRRARKELGLTDLVARHKRKRAWRS